jgi:hypothetical protein
MLTLALRAGDKALHIAHDRRMPARLAGAEQALGLVERTFDGLEGTFQRMAEVSMHSGRLDQYLEAVFPLPANRRNEAAVKRARIDRAATAERFENGRGNRERGVRGTLWAAYNSVTEYVDHARCGYTGEQRLHSIWFGRGQQIKQRAYALARDWAKDRAMKN